MTATPILEVRNVTRRFKGLTAVADVSFALAPRSITALVGPNGAGKTTCFNMVAGMLAPSSGEVHFDGQRVDGMPPEAICRRGLARTFQVMRPMPDMTLEENVMVGAFAWTNSVAAARTYAREVMHDVGMSAKADIVAQSLTLPDRKMLELCRALATKPKLLLLDEVMAGLRPLEADRIVALLRQLNAAGLTILLVEHVMRIVMSLAERVIVLHHGLKIADGAPDVVTKDAAVIESYLGTRSHGTAA